MSEPREPVYQPTPHRRRTPCCEIEAYRYLSEHGFEAEAVAQERERIAREIERLRDCEGSIEPGDWESPEDLLRAALAIVRGEDA